MFWTIVVAVLIGALVFFAWPWVGRRYGTFIKKVNDGTKRQP
jgi:phosphotransferase system  glucose/maltose/N-acetylglucosamine-specific IIC component